MKAQARSFFCHSTCPLRVPLRFLLPSHRQVRCSNPVSISKGGGNVSFAILRCIARAGALVSAVMLIPAAHAAVPDIPTVEGPITGPGEMQPGIRPGPVGPNLQDFGYVMEENFVSGVAPGQPYQTRLLPPNPPNPQHSTTPLLHPPTHP